MVDTQARECPAHPHEQPYHGECLAQEPQDAGDIVHYRVERCDADVYGRPSSKEYRCCNSRHHEEVEILSQIVEAEAHSRVFGMIAGGKLALGFSQVERAAVSLGVACHEEYKKSYNGRHVSFEYQPVPRSGLLCHDTRDLHCAGKYHGSDEAQAERHLIGYKLHGPAHCRDNAILVVARPSGKEDADDANA